MTFHTLVLECLSIKQYYELLYSNDEAKISPWLGQGVYTPDFLGMLLSCTPYYEMMDILAGLQNADIFRQMDLFLAWRKERVERISSMKNMILTVQDMGGKPRKQPDPDEEVLVETARRLVLETLSEEKLLMEEFVGVEDVEHPELVVLD